MKNKGEIHEGIIILIALIIIIFVFVIPEAMSKNPNKTIYPLKENNVSAW